MMTRKITVKRGYLNKTNLTVILIPDGLFLLQPLFSVAKLSYECFLIKNTREPSQYSHFLRHPHEILLNPERACTFLLALASSELQKLQRQKMNTRNKWIVKDMHEKVGKHTAI